VSLLAACSPDSITAPATPATPVRPNFDEDVGPGSDEGGSTINTSGSGTSNCILVVVVNPDGSTSMQCQVIANGQFGSGN
jgi:hypothetical protein